MGRQLGVVELPACDGRVPGRVLADAAERIEAELLEARQAVANLGEEVSGTVTISGLTLTGGVAAGDGGGIANRGADVSLNEMVIDGNSAAGDGAMIAGSGGGKRSVPAGAVSEDTGATHRKGQEFVGLCPETSPE